jgi:sRNA-binding regulator protein Hfq
MLELSQILEKFSMISIIVGAIFLYFGKIISDTKVGFYDKLSFYLEGLFFVPMFVFFPLVIAYFTEDIYTIPAWVWIIVQLLVLIVYGFIIIAHEHLRRYELLLYLEKRWVNGIKKLDKLGPINKSTIETSEEYLKKFGLDYRNILNTIFYEIPIQISKNHVIHFIISILALVALFQVFREGNIPMFAFSALLSFFILTVVALAYGFSNAKYPIVKMYLTNGKSKKGKVVKYDKDFVYVIKDNLKLSINKNQIISIETEIPHINSTKNNLGDSNALKRKTSN